MRKQLQACLLSIFVLAVYACIPVPVPVNTTPTYETTYGYGTYDDSYGHDYDYDYDEYVDVPIAYGEPIYYSPPITVSFYYDYFTYELAGPYVDIVFWRGGNRYRHHTWQEKGRRLTAADVRSTKPYHRISGKEFRKYREGLKRNHNVSHPDSYYGLKKPRRPASTTSPQSDRRPQMKEKPSVPPQQKPVWGTQRPGPTEQRPSWDKSKPTRVERPQRQPSVPPQRVERSTGPLEQRTQPVQQPPRQIKQKTQDVKPPPRKKGARETKRQAIQRMQQEEQKQLQDRADKTREDMKKTAEDGEPDREDMKRAWPSQRRR